MDNASDNESHTEESQHIESCSNSAESIKQGDELLSDDQSINYFEDLQNNEDVVVILDMLQETDLEDLVINNDQDENFEALDQLSDDENDETDGETGGETETGADKTPRQSRTSKGAISMEESNSLEENSASRKSVKSKQDRKSISEVEENFQISVERFIHKVVSSNKPKQPTKKIKQVEVLREEGQCGDMPCDEPEKAEDLKKDGKKKAVTFGRQKKGGKAREMMKTSADNKMDFDFESVSSKPRTMSMMTAQRLSIHSSRKILFTYQLDPMVRFDPMRVELVLIENLEEISNRLKTDATLSPRDLVIKAADNIRHEVNNLHFDRYRLCTFVALGRQHEYNGVHVDFRAIWDRQRDNYASHVTFTPTHFIVATCFALYRD